ncbi:dihydropteroate synthase [Bacteroidia bacterium]|nr:dihydropteroate synthase [Bacteroidia bacterium]
MTANRDSFYTINCRGRLISLEKPLVMGILNITPDSFSDGGRYLHLEDALRHVETMLAEGADVIDIGAVSTRPFIDEVSEQEELQRLLSVVPSLVHKFPETLFSVDTYRSNIAEIMVGEGIAIINDVFGGQFDDKMFETVGRLGVPYILMHTQGKPKTMQEAPHYTDIVQDLILYFSERIDAATQAGINDIIIDPGFGFGKTMSHNYDLLSRLDYLNILEKPMLVGVSRKSMIHKALHTTPQESANGTTVINTVALLKGAHILRVHDVREAKQTVNLINYIKYPYDYK